MINPETATQVDEVVDLLNALDRRHEQSIVLIKLKPFVQYLEQLASKHCKGWNDEYISEICFRKTVDFKSDAEFTQFARVSLCIACGQLGDVVKDCSAGEFVGGLELLKQSLRGYVFDLKPVIEWLERKNEVTLFQGGKSYRIESFQFFMLARRLSHGFGDLGDYKASQAAGIFVLRQALEARFFRVVGVDLRDKYGQTPKTRHGFHLDFIRQRPQFFKLSGCSLSQIERVYNWSNDIVHGAHQPLAWQVVHALKVCAPIFQSGPHHSGRGLSVHGAVQIHGLNETREAFLAHFRQNYDHGPWCANYFLPDAGIA